MPFQQRPQNYEYSSLKKNLYFGFQTSNAPISSDSWLVLINLLWFTYDKDDGWGEFLSVYPGRQKASKMSFPEVKYHWLCANMLI